ncbi:type II toxin-antitoxin system VapC family toxin [Pseudanabaena sp. PCC 6802]|uniref:type II toxin-antitoxin system VapC family toxin n=1 Tax=Pseudanabaena sp. PCC 6802 TaxID=118173 RepID=UPI0003496021|nr:type II toxin-antitoxin system VapC family toxin [Pseudanabaena sp. PCC 6802]
MRSKVAEFEADLVITIVTVQELFNGWVGRLNDPAQVNHQVRLYAKLSKVVAFIQEVEVLALDDIADRCFRQMLTDYPSLRKKRMQKDMRIAAIALSSNATVVTRNRRDFEQVPGLKIEDWTL